MNRPPVPPPVDVPDSYVFMWDRERIENVAGALRWLARNTRGSYSASLGEAADDLFRAVERPMTGARFVHRGAE